MSPIGERKLFAPDARGGSAEHVASDVAQMRGKLWDLESDDELGSVYTTLAHLKDWLVAHRPDHEQYQFYHELVSSSPDSNRVGHRLDYPDHFFYSFTADFLAAMKAGVKPEAFWQQWLAEHGGDAPAPEVTQPEE